MVRKILLALVVIVVLGGGFLLVQILFAGEEAPSSNSNNSNVQAKKKKERVWDGQSEHLYNMQIPDGSGGSLVLERVTFSGLRNPRATAVVRFTYLGDSLPPWLRPGRIKKSFSASYSSSDDRVASSLASGPLEDGSAVIDYTLKRVPSVRLDRNARRALFVSVRGLLLRGKVFSVRIVANPEPGYMLGGK
jgi:hypothetical protein